MLEFTVILFGFSNEKLQDKVNHILESFKSKIQFKFILLHRQDSPVSDFGIIELQNNVWLHKYYISNETIYEYIHQYKLPLFYSTFHRLYTKTFVSNLLSYNHCFDILSKFNHLLDDKIMLFSRFDSFFHCHDLIINDIIRHNGFQKIGLKFPDRDLCEDRYYFINKQNLLIFLSQSINILNYAKTIIHDDMNGYPEFIIHEYFTKYPVMIDKINTLPTIRYEMITNWNKYLLASFDEHMIEYLKYIPVFILPFSETRLPCISNISFLIDRQYMGDTVSHALRFDLFEEFIKYSSNKLLFVSLFAQVSCEKNDNKIKCNIFFEDNIIDKQYMICKIHKSIKNIIYDNSCVEIKNNILFVSPLSKSIDILFEF